MLSPLQKKTTSTSGSSSNPAASGKGAPAFASTKKAAVITKAKVKGRGGMDGHVLGNADYLTLAMGGRRKAKQEAGKLPVSMDEDES
jgi:hypothetical protein